MTLERFWTKVQKTDDCWMWTGAKVKGGYGNFYWEGRYNSPHRLLWTWLHGAVPDGLEVDHVCHDPAVCPGGPTCPHRRCVNPEHLALVTGKENSARTRNARLNYCKYRHRLTPENTYDRPGWAGRRGCRTCAAEL